MKQVTDVPPPIRMNEVRKEILTILGIRTWDRLPSDLGPSDGRRSQVRILSTPSTLLPFV